MVHSQKRRSVFFLLTKHNLQDKSVTTVECECIVLAQWVSGGAPFATTHQRTAGCWGWQQIWPAFVTLLVFWWALLLTCFIFCMFSSVHCVLLQFADREHYVVVFPCNNELLVCL